MIGANPARPPIWVVQAARYFWPAPFSAAASAATQRMRSAGGAGATAHSRTRLAQASGGAVHVGFARFGDAGHDRLGNRRSHTSIVRPLAASTHAPPTIEAAGCAMFTPAGSELLSDVS